MQQDGGTSANLASVRGDRTGKRAVAVGEGPTIVRTEDAGLTWNRVTAKRLPPPWTAVGLLLGLVAVARGLRRPEPVWGEEGSIADVLSSDKPIDEGERDALGFESTAGGLARFLANEHTTPPLTVAVTGEWGTGKSSLMNLVQAKVRAYGFRTVWFNAWHHQTEERLLGSLLESLRRQAAPAWWQPDGMALRIRLLLRRGARRWLPAFLTLLVFGVALGYFSIDPGERLNKVAALLSKAGAESPADTAGALLSILSMVGVLAPLAAALRGMRSIGVRSPRVGGWLQIGDPMQGLNIGPGFRHQFADAFRDFTRALGGRRLVIFIDDLDRCRPQNVLIALEMINFLVTSGDCFVIVGIARDRVERCVGLGFKDVAEELADGDSGESERATPEERGRRRRVMFARNYLEKLINIEVPVPTPTPKQFERLIVPDEAAAEKEAGSWLVTELRSVVARFAPLLALAAIVGAAFVAGQKLVGSGEVPALPQAADSIHAVVQGAPLPASEAATPQTTDHTQTETPQAEEDTGDMWFLGPPPAPKLRWVALFVPLAILFAFGLYRQTIKPKELERDSFDFRDALAIWYQLILAKTPNPRACKRFINRVRYYAMRQRSAVAEPIPRSRLFGRRKRIAEESTGGPWIPERVLVALSALQHADPNSIGDPLLDTDPRAFARKYGLHEEEGKELLAESPVHQFREDFVALSTGVRVN